jgi:peptidyl-prolyl cis-trans isomerase D
MMQQMRASAKWIMLFLALAFVGWMIFDVGLSAGQGGGVSMSDAVARVNGTKIDLQTFNNAVRNASEQQRQMYGSAPVTLEQQRALEDRVLESLIEEILLEQEFRRRDLGATDQEIIQAAQSSPPQELLTEEQFFTDGQFDLTKYQRYLAADRNLQFALEARYRLEIPRSKLFQQLTSDVYVSDAKLWQLYQDQHDSLTLRVLEIRPNVVVPDSAVVVTDAEVRQYYNEHRVEFEQEAVAFLSYMSVSRQPDASDSAAALTRVTELRLELEDGADFAQIARLESADSTSRVAGGDLGMQANDRFVPEFTSAARALNPGELSEPVRTPYGYHLIQVEQLEPDSLHARHILIPFELAGEHLDQVESMADTLDLLAAEQTDPAVLDDVARMIGETVFPAPPVVQGNRVTVEGASIPDAGMWAFEAEVGEISQVIETPDAFYAFRLDSLRQAGVPPFEQIQPIVRRAAINARKWEQARALANDLSEQLRGGQPLMEVALANVLSARTYGPMTRVSPAPALRPYPQLIGAGFGLGVGEPGKPIETDDAIFLVEPASKQLADSSAFVEQLPTQRQNVLSAARQNRVSLFLLSLRDNANVVDRRREIEQAQRAMEAQLADSPFPGNTGVGF